MEYKIAIHRKDLDFMDDDEKENIISLVGTQESLSNIDKSMGGFVVYSFVEENDNWLLDIVSSDNMFKNINKILSDTYQVNLIIKDGNEK
jgi:hypothetical protein